MANRLRAWRRHRDLTLSELANATGTDKTQISRLETGRRRLTLEWLDRLAGPLDCRPEDLLRPPPAAEAARGRIVPSEPAAPAPSAQLNFAGEDYAAIPAYDARAAAGAGSHLDLPETVSARILFRMQWLRSVSRAPLELLAAIEIDGDSMEPTLRSGDTALLDLSEREPRRKDGLYVLRREGGLQVKRVSAHPVSGRLTIRSDNTAYASYADVDPGAVVILGRVIWIGRRI
jgi:phage repressor protein C with HTH and peptisase S24 domain